VELRLKGHSADAGASQTLANSKYAVKKDGAHPLCTRLEEANVQDLLPSAAHSLCGQRRAGRVKSTENRLNLSNFKELQRLVKLALGRRLFLVPGLLLFLQKIYARFSPNPSWITPRAN
jgi:hypothetical protein